MRISAPWIGLPLESFTKPLSPADPCALTFSIRQNETNPIATTRMSIFMLQEYDFGRVCKTRPDTGNLPAEGLEPTRSCDHWILSPARLPFRHAGVSKVSERIRTSRRSSTRESFRSQTLPTKSSGWRLRGGPKISRKMIAFRKPDVDLSMVARLVLASADLEVG